MPLSWLKVAIRNAIRMGLRNFRWKSRSFFTPAADARDSRMAAISAGTSASPVRSNTASASRSRPWATSQRGLSGRVNSSTQKSRAGKASVPIIHCQSLGTPAMK